MIDLKLGSKASWLMAIAARMPTRSIVWQGAEVMEKDNLYDGQNSLREKK